MLKQQLTPPTEGISCHAWNFDKTMLAISPNNNEIHIFETVNWRRLHVLSEHDLLVSSIDWSAATNKIVSCSHDRNAFVWTFEPESVQPPLSVNDAPVIIPAAWKPALVILRIDRAAVDVKWSSDGLRFAVASGAKCVPVCTYDVANDWWVCKMVKKFKSTVLCCSFHPSNGQLLATGCADFKCRVFSTFATNVDGSNVNPLPFSSPVEFGETYLELGALGWIHAVGWSPSGNTLAFAGHDCSIHFVTDFGCTGDPVIRTLRLQSLPMCSLLFVGENVLVGAGHDFNPTVFTASKGEWSSWGLLDKPSGDLTAGNTSVSTTVSNARELFVNKTVRGQDSKLETDTLKTVHDRPITVVQDASPQNGDKKISTSGLDGRIVIWTLSSLGIDLATMFL